MVERGLSAGELGNVVRRSQRFGRRETQGSAFRDVAGLPWGRTPRKVHQFGRRGCRS
jgi:hypothetical protein